jgi:hypothetical protein
LRARSLLERTERGANREARNLLARAQQLSPEYAEILVLEASSSAPMAGVRLFGPDGRELAASDGAGRIRVPARAYPVFSLEGEGGAWIPIYRRELPPGSRYIVKLDGPPVHALLAPKLASPTRYPPFAPILTLVAPVAAVVGAFYAPPVLLAFPLGLGAGHFYAGETGRGLWISAGSLFPVISAVWSITVGFEGGNFRTAQATVGTIASAAMFLGYWGWAAADAFDTAEQNEYVK